jgi:ABC-type microcin C transport system duplicated ATPase subunit YejF
MLPLSTPSSTHIPPPPAYPLWAFPSQSERPRPLIALDSVSKTYLMGSTHVKALGGALDTQTSKEIMGIFADLNASGMTVILVTHDMEVARQTRRMIWLRDGEVIHAALNPAELSEVTVLSQSSHKEYV